MIEDIEDAEVVTSCAGWMDAVQVREGENQIVSLTFSPGFERMWLESKKRLPKYLAEWPANIGLRSKCTVRLYRWVKK
jgi:hypothetical protein